MSEEKFLLLPAAGDIDEDEGMTLSEILHMLADQLGYSVIKVPDEVDEGEQP